MLTTLPTSRPALVNHGSTQVRWTLAEADKPAPTPNSVDLSVMPQGYKCRHDAAEGGWILTGPNGATLNFVPFPNLAAALCFAHDAAGWPG